MIPLVKTYMPPKEELIPALEQVLYSGYVAQGEVVEKFEEAVATYIGNKYCLTVNSGTSALHIALILAGVESGDEVISTVITAEPTNTAITQTGAKIVWADIDLSTGNICPNDVEKKITEKTKAIMVVDYAGVPVDIQSFQKIEKKYGIPVIQDSAHAFGASYMGKKLGNHFKYTSYSFQAIKHLTTVDGGLLVLNNSDEYETAKLIRWFGLDKKLVRSENNISIQGYKYHMNNVNATIGLAQMERVDWLVGSYIENGKFYDHHLKGIPGLKLLEYYEGSEPSYWLYTIRVDKKNDFVSKMVNAGIMVADLHKRNDKHSIFHDSEIKLINVDLFEKEWVHIPCGWWVTHQERAYIVDTIKKGW